MISRILLVAMLSWMIVPLTVSARTVMRVEVSNSLSVDRLDELIEVPLPKKGQHYVAVSRDGQQYPTQVTYDGHLLFPVSVPAGGKEVYRILSVKQPLPVDTLVYGRAFPERLDDFAWENERAAYRAYGPALQRSGERAYGYDVLTKSVSRRVLEERYALELSPEARRRISQWRKEGLRAKADSLARAISYHVDHGNGMDVYSVGPTLGAGTTALVQANGELVYPWAYERVEVLEKGPLRFTFRLTYPAAEAAPYTGVVEKRLISLERGSYFNRALVSYEGLDAPTPLACGIVIHPQHPDGYFSDARKGILAYADSTDRAHVGNGVIYIGAIAVHPFHQTEVRLFSSKERQQRGGALGHLLGLSSLEPGKTFEYYWGSAWSKAGPADFETWKACLEAFSQRLHHPLNIKIK